MSHTHPQPTESPVAAPRSPPHRRRWPIVVGAIVALLIVFCVIADHVTLDYYAIAPGEAQSVGPLIHVPPSKAHPVNGSVLLTDVYLSPVTLLGYVPDLLSSNTELIPTSNVLEPGTSPAQLTDQGYLEMAQSQSAAKALALQTLGYTVPERDAGTLIFSVQSGSPAASVLSVAQIITAVDGTPTPNDCAFVGAIHDKPAGTVVRLSVEQSTVTPEAEIKPGPVVTETVRLAEPPAGLGSSGCPGVTGPAKGYLGISPETQQDFTYPFPINVDTTDIGGPSAGLAMTLGIIDKLSTGDLTGHHVVAATGTIASDGTVGDVSGVPQKTVAVEQAGATDFLVPPQELKAAESKANGSLHVYAVSTLQQALSVLRRLGGQVPTTH